MGYIDGDVTITMKIEFQIILKKIEFQNQRHCNAAGRKQVLSKLRDNDLANN